MGRTARTLACRFSLFVIASLALAVPAQAGTYDVLTCDVAPEGVNNSWSPVATNGMSTGQHCPSAGRDAGGLFAGNAVNVGTIPAFSGAAWSFDAPSGTSIVYMAARYWFHRRDPYWRLGVFADGSMLHGCEPAPTEPGCEFHSRSIDRATEWSWAGGVRNVSIVTACGSGFGCRTDTASPTGDRGGVRLYSATVRVQDSSAPSVWDVGDGPLTSGGWRRGSEHVGFASSDNVGIRRTRLYVDGRQLQDNARDCDFTRRVPCSDVGYGQYTVDTAALADGDHELRVESVDAAGNSGSYRAPFRTDNRAPDAPSNVAVDGGDAWRQTNQFRVTWKNSASASPTTIARYRLCNVDTSTCTEGARAAGNINSISDLSVPAPGHYTLRLFLQDEMGNVNTNNLSEPVHLRFDNVAPGRALPQRRNGWLSKSEAREFSQIIDLELGELRPVSNIAGYSVTTDGSEPGTSINSAGGLYRLTNLREGITTVKARAVSGAGVPSAKVGSTTIAADLTAPAARVSGLPAGVEWSRVSVTARITGIDQLGLSGMGPAPPGAPTEEGGFIAYRVDDTERIRTRGDVADVSVADDGTHVIAYQAVDAAGNESAEQVAEIRVDRTAPELVVFEDQQPDDPRRVVVAAADRTSGLQGGQIELRRIGDTEWKPLGTSRDGGRFSAMINDESLGEGIYELRARVTDAAGNEATGDRRRDGSPARFDPASLRADTKLETAFEVKGTPKKKKCKRVKGRKKCSTTKATPPSRARSLKVAFGQSAIVRGSLRDGASGLADAVVDVYSKPKADGSAFVPVGSVRTDGRGDFVYKANSGTGRVLSFRYAGTPTYRGSADELTLLVGASATLRVNRKRARNGETVNFTGALKTRPLAGAKKALLLQAFYRRRWRTFASPTTDKKGRWKYRYRFEATRGRVVYRFRVIVPAGADYPYEKATSKAVSVTVSGRR